MTGARTDEGAERLRRAVDRGSRRSAGRAVAFLVLALGAALVAGYLIKRYMDDQLRGGVMATVKVAIAASELTLGMTLKPEMLRVVTWPADAKPDGSFADPAALVGRVVLTRIFRGEPVLEPKLASSDAGWGLAAVLPPGMLAVSVRVDDVVGVAGFIYPGNRVDVIAAMEQRGGLDKPMAKIVLQNIEVLAVGKSLEQKAKDARAPIPATVATLAVTPDQAERLALASIQGKLLLGLRSSLDTTLAATEGIAPAELFAIKQAITAARTKAPAAPQPRKDTIEIMRGDLFEQRQFEGTRNP